MSVSLSVCPSVCEFCIYSDSDASENMYLWSQSYPCLCMAVITAWIWMKYSCTYMEQQLLNWWHGMASWDIEKLKPCRSMGGVCWFQVLLSPSYDDSLRLCRRFCGNMVNTNKKQLLVRTMDLDFLWFLDAGSGWDWVYEDEVWWQRGGGDMKRPWDKWLWDKEGGGCWTFITKKFEFKDNCGMYEMILRDGVKVA